VPGRDRFGGRWRYVAGDNAAFGRAGWRVSHLALFPEPNVADVQEHLLAQDLVWVAGGSVANLLALWRLHGIGPAMHAAWQAGVVLMGVSAGSVCWFADGTTDAFGLPLRPVTDALGFLPHSNSPTTMPRSSGVPRSTS
jgi:peptidase E